MQNFFVLNILKLMNINLYFGIIVGLILVIVLPILIFIFLFKHKKSFKIFTTFYFICYFVSLFILTTAQIKFSNSLVTINLAFDNNWFSPKLIIFGGGTFNIFINIIMFFPLGLLTFWVNKKHKFISTIIFSFIISVFVETMQLILPVNRTTELFDIILNTISGIISAFSFYVLYNLKNKTIS